MGAARSHTPAPEGSQDARAIVVVILVLVGSLALNVRLGWRLKKLDAILAGTGGRPRAVMGAIVPSIQADNLEGKRTLITYAGYPPTVVYVFVPPCKWCARNLANIQALAGAAGRNYRFVGLSLTAVGLKQYAAANNLKFPVYTDIAPEAIGALGLGSTPQTLVVSPEGKLLKNWVGAYGGGVQREIEQYFGIPLPGVTP